MAYFMFMIALGFGLYGFLVMNFAASAIHEIEAFLLYLIAAMFFCSGIVIGILVDIKKSLAGDESDTKETLPHI